MPLTIGTRLGPYEIAAKLGEGGMGEVYRATDTRLSRTVAIKVLPPHWADNTEMKQRFDREARTIASLSDPHICALHDIGRESPSTGSGQAAIDFLVMEYLEGETLSARITRGPIAIADALAIAIAITSALDTAHRQGVIHRDLKPSNVMLTAGGAKLLDFGLAKPAMGATASARELSTPGMMLGTLQYMAPEQLEGAEADTRSDLFALGVIVHEMVTGKKVFEAKSRVLLMSAIATHQPPPLSLADPATPAELEHIIETCIAKDPADRWQTARDVLGELQAIADGSADGKTAGALTHSSSSGSRLYRGLAAAAVFAAVGVSTPAMLYLRGEASSPETRFRVPMQLTAQTISVPIAGVASGALFGPSSFALSPDGRSLAFMARTAAADPFTLYVRPIGAVVPQPLTTGDNTSQPFWSADGRSIAFVSSGRLKKIAVEGGAPQDLCAVTGFSGGSWNRDNVIIFGSASGLFRVPGDGGTPQSITTLDGTETGHFWPTFLPDGRRFLYTAWSADASARAIYAGELGAKERTRILDAESNAVYSATGHLLFHRGKAVFAQAFDPQSLSLSGEPARVADEVTFTDEDGRGHFAVSASGVLAYFENAGGGGAGQGEGAQWQLAWITRGNQLLDRPGRPGAYRGFELSPDATRIAIHRHEPAGGDIWIFEPSGSETRLTFNAAQHNSSPIWSPDGRDVVYSSVRDGKWGLYRKRSDGAGAEELLFESDLPKAPMSWSPDGTSIVFGVQDKKTKGDLWRLTLSDKKAAPLVNTPSLETHAQISPDGKWIAYSSDEVGNRREIHVQPFPSGAGRWQVSDAGGDWPRWRKDGKELFYHSIGPAANPSAQGNLTPIGPASFVAVTANGAHFEHSAPRAVLNFRALNFPHGGADYHTYGVAPDGNRFLYLQFVPQLATAAAQATVPDHPSGLMIALNWDQGIKK